MKNGFYIIGSGGFAKEVLLLYHQIYGTIEMFNGFIDVEPKNKYSSILFGKKYPIINESDFLEEYKNDSAIDLYIGIGNPNIIEKLQSRFSGFSFPNLIHPNVIIEKHSFKMGKGNIITAGCIFTIDIEIGSFNIFNLSSTIGHDVIIGDCNVINPKVAISGGVKINNVNLLGTGCTILQGIQIQNYTIIGGSALLTKDVEDGQIMIGVPAKKMDK